jgi:hypothetical protein
VILSGIAAVALLVAVGLWLLRQWLMPFYPPLETVFRPERDSRLPRAILGQIGSQ